MKKTIIALALGSIAASGTAFAGEVESKVYGGAELGGNFGIDDQFLDKSGEEATFEWDNTLTVGGEISKQVHPEAKAFIGAEADFTFGETDEDVLKGNDTEVDVFVLGVETKAGVSTFGVQNGIADDYAEFADLSIEHGLNSNFDVAISDKDSEYGQETFQHRFTNETVDAGVSYDLHTEAVVLAGSVKIDQLTLGGAYLDGGDKVDGQDLKAVTLGAVYDVNEQIAVAAKYDANEMNDVDSDAYALSGTFALNSKVKFAGSYNNIDFDDNAFDDDFFTLGASYQVNNSVELVTDYKFASEEDDQLFVRANIDF